MSESHFSQILHMFDAFLELLENPCVDTGNTKDLNKIFDCAVFVEAAITKAYNEKVEDKLENVLCQHWLKKKRSKIYKVNDLKYACDKLLEIYMKDTSISTTTVDDLVKLYTQTFGLDRLNKFFQCTLRNSICTNIILKSIECSDISMFKIEDEALIVTWEVEAENGRQMEVSQKISMLLEDGYVSKIIYLVVNLHDKSEVKRLIMQCLLHKVVENDVQFFLASMKIEEKLLLQFLNNSSEFYIHFIDAIFYFGRNMSKVNDEWILNTTFNYSHLLKIIQVLLNGSDEIQRIVHSRIQLAKVQPDGSIWHDIEEDIAR